MYSGCQSYRGQSSHDGGENVASPIDVLTGDYLAELTMLILAKAQAKDASGGYAKTFLVQLEQVLDTCLDRRTGAYRCAEQSGHHTGTAGAGLRRAVGRQGR
ncbi:MAG: DUF1446 domain-containing protein [Pseudonocardia sp.]|nr:DUF1446 domain-containing protein [Pseudonocardia sp.]